MQQNCTSLCYYQCMVLGLYVSVGALLPWNTPWQRKIIHHCNSKRFNIAFFYLIQGLFGVLLFVYLPTLDPYPGYSPVRNELVEDSEYEELPGREPVCPERHVNIFSSTLSRALLVSDAFFWMWSKNLSVKELWPTCVPVSYTHLTLPTKRIV